MSRDMIFLPCMICRPGNFSRHCIVCMQLRLISQAGRRQKKIYTFLFCYNLLFNKEEKIVSYSLIIFEGKNYFFTTSLKQFHEISQTRGFNCSMYASYMEVDGYGQWTTMQIIAD